MKKDFEDYVQARWPRLVRAAVLLGCTVPEAEDVVQSALVKCMPRWTKILEASDIDAYVHKVVINTFLTARQRRWNSEVPTERLPTRSYSDHADVVVRKQVIAEALATLTPQHRAVVVLRFYAHLSEQQCAEALDIPVGTVKSRSSRALAALAAHPGLGDLAGTHAPDAAGLGEHR